MIIQQAYRGLLWREWRQHGEEIQMRFLSLWIAGTGLLLFAHPYWILGVGCLQAMVAGRRFGGAEAAEGAEEFSFALPPMRAERYLARLLAGGLPLVMMLAGALFCLSWSIPQKFWSLFVESGLTEPFASHPAHLYALAFAGPLSVFSLTYAFEAYAGSRGSAAATPAVMIFSLLLCATGWVAWHAGETPRTILVVAFPFLSAGALTAGFFLYRRKEGIARPSEPARSRLGRIVLWAGLALLLALVLFVSTRSAPEFSSVVRSSEVAGERTSPERK